jgi:WD40 repeat protein
VLASVTLANLFKRNKDTVTDSTSLNSRLVSCRQFLFLFSSGGTGTSGFYRFSFFTFCSGVGVEAVQLACCGRSVGSQSKQMLADANKLITDGRFKGIRLFASLAGLTSYVWSVAFSPEGQQIVSGSNDKLVKV